MSRITHVGAGRLLHRPYIATLELFEQRIEKGVALRQRHEPLRLKVIDPLSRPLVAPAGLKPVDRHAAIRIENGSAIFGGLARPEIFLHDHRSPLGYPCPLPS